jgi:hypothetical protein
MFKSVAILVLTAIGASGGTVNLTDSTVVAFSQTWDVCGNVSGGATLAVSTLGSTSSTCTVQFTGPILLPTFIGTSISAAKFSFFASAPGTLLFTGSALSPLGDFTVEADLYAGSIPDNAVSVPHEVFFIERTAGTYPNLNGNMNYGAGTNAFLVAVMTDGPNATFTINALTQVPEPRLTLLVASALLALLWFRQRNSCSDTPPNRANSA